MKYRRFVKQVAISFTLIVAVYLLSLLRGFDDTVVIYNATGLPQDQVNELLTHARNIGSFPASTIEHLRRKSRWTPWSRAKLFMSIKGTQDEVEVQAGFDGGPLYGGGQGFSARRVFGKWQFSQQYHWVS
jgi:hypothetical protein